MDPTLQKLLDDIKKSVDDIKVEQSDIQGRLNVVENRGPGRHSDHSYATHSTDHTEDEVDLDGRREAGPRGRRQNARNYPINTATGALQLPDLDDIQQEFTIIKDSLQRVRLPKDLKVEDSRQGVKRSDQGRINNISKCARYTETALKLLSTIDPDNVSQGDVNDLIIINVAMVRYLQEEHALVHVGGSFGDNVERIYRNFRRNTSIFDSQAIDSLQAAVSLDAAQPHNSYPGNRGRGRGYQTNNNYFRGRGHGSSYNSVYRFNRNTPGNGQFPSSNAPAASGGQSAGGDSF